MLVTFLLEKPKLLMKYFMLIILIMFWYWKKTFKKVVFITSKNNIIHQIISITEAVMIDIYNTGYIRRYYLLESLIIKGFTCYFPNSMLKVMSPNYKLQEIYLSTDF